MKRLLLILLFIITVSAIGHSQLLSKSDSFPHYRQSEKDSGMFMSVEIQAAFPGGTISWTKFLENNLNNSVPINNNAPKGSYKVVVAFVVDKDGSLSDIKLINDPGYGTGQEVIRVLNKSPKWIPGITGGRYVKSYRSQGITFQVN